MERTYYSIYNAIGYGSAQHGDFFAVKNLLNAIAGETLAIDRALARHGLIGAEDLDRYCFVPGGLSPTDREGIFLLLDFYAVRKDDLEIIGKIQAYPLPDTCTGDFMILCDGEYAKSHGWIEK